MKNVIFSMRIYSEDTDSFGIVHHANYLKFMERARCEWLMKKGFSLTKLLNQDTLFVVRHVDIRYLAPAKAYELIDIHTTIIKHRKVSATFSHRVVAQSNPEKIHCEATIEVVCIDSQFKPKVFPSQLLEE